MAAKGTGGEALHLTGNKTKVLYLAFLNLSEDRVFEVSCRRGSTRGSGLIKMSTNAREPEEIDGSKQSMEVKLDEE